MAEAPASPDFQALLRRWLTPVVFAAALLPLAWYAWRAANGALGANPIEATTRYFGDWALRFLLIALAVTPVRLVFGWAGVGRLRRGHCGLWSVTRSVLCDDQGNAYEFRRRSNGPQRPRKL